MTEKAMKYQKQIDDMNLKQKLQDEEQERGRIRNLEIDRLQAIENKRLDRQMRITALVVAIIFLIFAKYIAQFFFVVIILIGITLGVLQMIFSSGGFK